jgi:hypothetical protein
MPRPSVPWSPLRAWLGNSVNHELIQASTKVIGPALKEGVEIAGNSILQPPEFNREGIGIEKPNPGVSHFGTHIGLKLLRETDVSMAQSDRNRVQPKAVDFRPDMTERNRLFGFKPCL